MSTIQDIYQHIATEGFSDTTLQKIDNYIKEIQDGTEDFPRFNLSEHAGLCKGGAPLIGASIIACYATASLTTGGNVESSQGNGLFPEPAMKVIFGTPRSRRYASCQCLY